MFLIERTVIIFTGNAFLSLKKFRFVDVAVADIFRLRKRVVDGMDFFPGNIYFYNALRGELRRFFAVQTVFCAVRCGFFIKWQGNTPDFFRTDLFFIGDRIAENRIFSG